MTNTSTSTQLPSAEEPQLSNTHRALMILGVSLIGLFVNFITILVMTKHKNFRNPFGYQMNTHVICNFFQCLVFATFVVSVSIWGFPDYLLYVKIRIGQIMLFLCLTSYNLCLTISINRVVAIGFPHIYSRIYTKKGTYAFIAVAALEGFIYALVYSTESCYFIFDETAGGFVFSTTPMGDFMAAFDMRYTIALFTLVGICDLTTLLLLRRHRKKLQAMTSVTGKQQMAKEVRFFLQALLTSFVYIAVTINYHVLYYQMATPLGQFITATLAWPISSTCPGIILMFFNREMSNCLFKGHFLKLKQWTASHHSTTILVQTVSRNTK